MFRGEENAKEESAWLCVVPASLVPCLAYFPALRWRRHVPQKRRLTFNRLHGVISLTTELFIPTAVKTSNPSYSTFFVGLIDPPSISDTLLIHSEYVASSMK
jgi:hypothetical protein